MIDDGISTNQAAGFSVGGLGPQGGMPYRDEIEEK